MKTLSALCTLALAGYANAQDIQASASFGPGEHHSLRVSGSHGYVDFFGQETNQRYGELYVSKNIPGRKYRALGEANISNNTELDVPPIIYRFGLGYSSGNERTSVSVKVLPVNIAPGKFHVEIQGGASTKVLVTPKLFAQAWVDYNFIDKFARGEVTFGQNFSNKWALHVQAAYNANVPGFIFRTGSRYRLR